MKLEINEIVKAIKAFKEFFGLFIILGENKLDAGLAANQATLKFSGIDLFSILNIEI